MSIIIVLYQPKLRGFMVSNFINSSYFDIFYTNLINTNMESQMNSRHKSTLINSETELANYFKKPNSARQKQYEAIRAIAI